MLFLLLFSCQVDFRAIVIFYVIYEVTPLLFYSTAHEVLHFDLFLPLDITVLCLYTPSQLTFPTSNLNHLIWNINFWKSTLRLSI